MEIVKNYNSVKQHVFGEGNAVLNYENGCIRVSERAEAYSSLAVHAHTLLGKKQAYKSRIAVKLPEGNKPIMLRLYHKVYIDYLDVDETSYAYSDDIVVTDSSWSEVTLSTTVPFGSTILDFIVYFIQSKGARCDILVKELSVEETEPQAIEERLRNEPNIELQDKYLVGTIRWDAFSESTPEGMTPSSQVARVLSHKEYHNQTPFFANVDGEKISFPPYTLETWEKEALFAQKGGIDYFAYLWYETTDLMSEPRKLHLLSPNKDKILMCGILERVRTPETMDELYSAMKDSCYLRLDGRPVVFLYGVDRWSKENVKRVCDGAVEKGITQPLYVVGMSTETKGFPFLLNLSKGIDAVSWYSVGATEKDMPFQKLADSCEDVIVKAAELCRVNNIDIIPAFTAGRDTRARIRTGVSWCAGDPDAQLDKDKPYGNKYALPPTNEQLEAHMRFTLEFVKNNKDVCRPQMVCSYGWNEHEEGGWLCPTLKVDENNNVIRDENGNILPDTTRLDILSKVKNSLN